MSMMSKLMDSWYVLLNGSVTVAKEDGEEEQTGNFVLLMAEGGTDDSNKRGFKEICVVITDIITFHENNVDRSVVEGMDDIVFNAALSKPFISNLSAQTGMQILSVRRETYNYVRQRSVGGKLVYRKISRYTHEIYST